jgi:hypothetical protein
MSRRHMIDMLGILYREIMVFRKVQFFVCLVIVSQIEKYKWSIHTVEYELHIKIYLKIKFYIKKNI